MVRGVFLLLAALLCGCPKNLPPPTWQYTEDCPFVANRDLKADYDACEYEDRDGDEIPDFLDYCPAKRIDTWNSWNPHRLRGCPTGIGAVIIGNRGYIPSLVRDTVEIAPWLGRNDPHNRFREVSSNFSYGNGLNPEKFQDDLEALGALVASNNQNLRVDLVYYIEKSRPADYWEPETEADEVAEAMGNWMLISLAIGGLPYERVELTTRGEMLFHSSSPKEIATITFTLVDP